MSNVKVYVEMLYFVLKQKYNMPGAASFLKNPNRFLSASLPSKTLQHTKSFLAIIKIRYQYLSYQMEFSALTSKLMHMRFCTLWVSYRLFQVFFSGFDVTYTINSSTVTAIRRCFWSEWDSSAMDVSAINQL